MTTETKIRIEIERYYVPTDPSTYVFQVLVHRGESVWHETCNTEELLHMFLRGVQAGSPEFVSLPEIPFPNQAKNLPKSRSDLDIPF